MQAWPIAYTTPLVPIVRSSEILILMQSSTQFHTQYLQSSGFSANMQHESVEKQFDVAML